ncbi:hypothetical protein [Catenovulum agarivorans]|uniref:hypothetical protein n=1 Tax=Catenovulum agarivorans TaxID=1172192 RepID=UPI0002EA7113|nr:hypothetical protein [Catenovulum agarivorans]
MESIYSTPLHGVGCKPFCDDTETRFDLNVSFGAIEPFLANQQSVWRLTDKGQRYLTDLEIVRRIMPDSKDFNYLLKVNCEGRGTFCIQPSSINVDWELAGTDSAHYFQSLAIALWLELHAVPCIHANALCYQNNTIALIAPSKTGKTTLTLALIKQGFVALTDDMVALHKNADTANFEVYPSWPYMRLWPDSVKTVLQSDPESFNKVHERFEKRVFQFATGQCAASGRQLNTIYLLNRVDDQELAEKLCHIEVVSSARALILLLQNSMLASAYKNLGIEQQRLNLLAELLKSVKFKCINYASGLQHLDDISQYIREDVVGM